MENGGITTVFQRLENCFLRSGGGGGAVGVARGPGGGLGGLGVMLCTLLIYVYSVLISS